MQKHIVSLDGLRGIAALIVAYFHSAQLFTVLPGINHAYLAVDFFFCLSGYVVASAYDAKLASSMSLYDFSQRRLVRLYPLIALSVLLGAIVYGFGALMLHRHGLGHVAVVTGASLLLLPVGLFFGEHAFPVNNPIWSLFFELVANAFYAVQCRLHILVGRGLLIGAATILAILIASVSVEHNGVEEVGFKSWWMFLEGGVRVAFPFLAGVAIWRFDLPAKLPVVSYLVVCAVMVCMMCGAAGNFRWLYDSGAIIVVIPFIVAFSVRSLVNPSATPFLSFIGALSYPLYLMHYPLLRVTANATRILHLAPLTSAAVAIFSLVICAILALAVERIFDTPVQAWLSKKPEPRTVAA